MPNIPEFFSVVFGLFRAALIPVFALAAHRRVEIGHFVAASEASAYIIAESHEGFDYRQLAAQVRDDRADRDDREGLAVVVVGNPGPFLALAELERTAAPRSTYSPSPQMWL